MTDARVAPSPPPARTTSILPAAIVLAVAVGTLALFGLLNLVVPSAATSGTAPIVVGGLPVAHTALFAHAVQDDVPPPDVATALLVPKGARFLGAVNTGGGGPSDYDVEYRFSIGVARAELLGFYRSQLEARGWSLYSDLATSSTSAQLLFQRAGSDGFYWEAGVKATSQGARATAFTYRLFQNDSLG